jgi:hypothetical protein
VYTLPEAMVVAVTSPPLTVNPVAAKLIKWMALTPPTESLQSNTNPEVREQLIFYEIKLI